MTNARGPSRPSSEIGALILELRASGMPYATIAEKLQVGETFARRMGGKTAQGTDSE